MCDTRPADSDADGARAGPTKRQHRDKRELKRKQGAGWRPELAGGMSSGASASCALRGPHYNWASRACQGIARPGTGTVAV